MKIIRHDNATIVNHFGQSVCELRADELRMSSSADADSIRLNEIKKRRALVVKQTFVLLFNFVLGDSEVLRMPPLRQAATRYGQCYLTTVLT